MRKAVSLFAGAGGFCEGVRLAGFKVVCAVEADHDACKTHAANFKNVALFEGDVGRFLRDDQDGVPSRGDLIKADIDLVYGGPPCQGFSIIGPRKLNDPRNRLYKQFVRVVRELRPAMFIMENVPNMVTMENGHYKKKILGAFGRAGYKRTAIVPLVSSSFGVPQHRRRVFVFGLRDGLPCKEGLEQRIQKFLRKEELPDQVTVGEAISDLPERVSAEDAPVKYPARRRRKLSAFQRLMRLDCDTRLLSKKKKGAAIDEHALHNHHTKGIESRRKKIIRAIQPGGTGDLLPTKLWSGVRGHKWRRLDPDQPSYTILAQMHRDLSEWIHPDYDRWITVREAARLQSFHDGFVLYGSECQQLKQVGNAVPPLMALAVARASKRLLESVSRTSARKR